MRDKIRLLAETEVEEGTSKRFKCLICNGGSSGEKSLSITRAPGKILYKCFRDTCGESGIIPSNDLLVPRVPGRVKSYTGELANLEEVDFDFFKKKFNLDQEDLWGVKKAVETGRYMLPIVGPRGQLRGHVARSLDGQIPKAITYKYRAEEPFVGWIPPIGKQSDNYPAVVVVEDWFSAVKVAKCGVPAVTINGTHISWEIALELGAWADEIILALDRGTLPTMLKHARMFGSCWERFRIWNLDVDLKYEQEEKIINAVTNREATSFRLPEGSVGL